MFLQNTYHSFKVCLWMMIYLLDPLLCPCHSAWSGAFRLPGIFLKSKDSDLKREGSGLKIEMHM